MNQLSNISAGPPGASDVGAETDDILLGATMGPNGGWFVDTVTPDMLARSLVFDGTLKLTANGMARRARLLHIERVRAKHGVDRKGRR